MKYILILTIVLFGSCNSGDGGINTTVTDADNTVLDSSAIMNDSTRLPNDSTNMGVMH